MRIVQAIAGLVMLGSVAAGVSACDYSGPTCAQGHYDYWTTTHYYSSGSGKYARRGSYTTLDPYWVCDRWVSATNDK